MLLCRKIKRNSSKKSKIYYFVYMTKCEFKIGLLETSIKVSKLLKINTT